MTESPRKLSETVSDERPTLLGRLLGWVFGPRLAWQFSIPSLVILLIVGLAAGFGVSAYMSARLEAEALEDAIRQVERESSEITPWLSPDQLLSPMIGSEYVELDRLVRQHVIAAGVLRVKIWNQSGTLIYSDDPSTIGQVHALEGKLASALAGESAGDVEDLSDADLVANYGEGKVFEVYTPLRLGDSPEVLGAFEMYQDHAPVLASIAASQRMAYLATGVGLAVIYVALLIVQRRGAAIIARQRSKLVLQTAELEESYDATLQALGLALDMRDHATEGHCQRVSDLATAVAREMNISGDELEVVARGAVVHDIGKITLADAVLTKPGPLTDDEWREMRKHPELGYEMLKDIPVLRDAAQIVFSHQEKYDGTGYPRGLKGEEIPLGGRIFAVVDAYDAITSDRPYRKAAPHEHAMEEIIRCAGTQFDPEVVRAFCEAEEKGLIRAPHRESPGDGSRPQAVETVARAFRR